jgi:hypothetical protein
MSSEFVSFIKQSKINKTLDKIFIFVYTKFVPKPIDYAQKRMVLEQVLAGVLL